jgi:predicted transcriptional regulator
MLKPKGRPPKAVHNCRRTISLSPRHDKMLTLLAEKLDTTKTATIERALESLEEKEARRDKEIRV